VHVILLDNGRSRLLGTVYEEALQCIRCGACLNICPVYREAGGHAYASPYSGPIGAVVSPLLLGLQDFPALPHASTLCGACQDVCPVRIDLPRMLLELRAEEVSLGLASTTESLLEKGAAFVLAHERLLGLVRRAVAVSQKPFVRNQQVQLPRAVSPTGERKLPSFAPRSFHQLWEDLQDE
jgi:L-lactate dehydrogenase complex protein LldF